MERLSAKRQHLNPPLGGANQELRTRDGNSKGKTMPYCEGQYGTGVSPSGEMPKYSPFFQLCVISPPLPAFLFSLPKINPKSLNPKHSIPITYRGEKPKIIRHYYACKGICSFCTLYKYDKIDTLMF